MTQMCIVRWQEGDSWFIDYKIIGVDIPEDIALKLVANEDAEIIEVEEVEV